MIQNIITLSLLIAAVIFLRTIFRKKVPARLIYALWLAVVIKLCIPVSLLPVLTEPVKPEAPYSHDAPTVSVDSETDKTPSLYEVADEHAVQPTHSDITPEYSPSIPVIDRSPVNQTPVVQPIGDITEHTPVTPSEKPAVDYTRVLFIAWGVLSAAVALFFALTGTVFSVKLHRTREYVGKVKRFKVYSTSAVSTPCVSGLYPTIYITPDMKDSFADSLALTHELAHIRHGDNFWAIFRIAALVVYPWNPLVWAAAILSKRDSEFACDEAVTKKMNKSERLGYAQMLVDSASAKPRGVVGLGSAPLGERIRALIENRKDRIIFIIVAVVLAAAVVLCSFLGFKKEKTETPADENEENTVVDASADKNGADTEDSDTDHAEKYLSVKVINEGECSVKLVTAEDCTLIESYHPYFRKEGKTYVILPDAFSGNLYSYVTKENGKSFCYTLDLSTRESHGISTDSNDSLSDSIITGGALYIAPASSDSDGKEKISLYKHIFTSGSTECITDISVSDTRVDISALDDSSIVFLVNRRDGEDTVPTVYRCNNMTDSLSVVFESRDSDEKICCIDAYGGQIYAVTVKDDNGWKIHSLKTYSRDGALILSEKFRALDSIVQQNEYKYYYMEFFGDYISMKLERDGYFINSPTFEKTDDGYRTISFSYTGMANTTMAEPASGHYYTVGINGPLGQIAVFDTEKHEQSFIRFDLGDGKTVSPEKIYCDEYGKLLFVTTDTDGNEQLWTVNDSLEEIVLSGKSGRFTVTADSLDELKKYVDAGTLGQSGEEFYDYFYSFFVEGWKFPEVNEVKFSDISFSFTYPFVNLDGIDVNFTVVESPLEELKPGKYSIKVAEGMMDFYITGLNEEKNEKTIEMLRKYEEVHKLLLFFNSCRLWNTPAYGKGVTYPGAMDFVYVYYGETGNWYKLDEESLYRHLEEDFGVTEPEKLIVRGTLLGDGQYNSLYEGYPQEQRSVLDVKETSDGIEVTVRFYADTEMLIRSHLIVYYFDKDSRFNGYTVLEKGKYEPAGIHFIPDDDKEADKTPETTDKSDETSDEVYTIPKKEIKCYLYFYADSSGRYFSSRTQYNAEKEGYTAFHVLPCRFYRANTVSMNKRYAIIDDGQYFIYDFIDGKKVCDLLFADPFRPELPNYDDTLPRYLPVEDNRSYYDADSNRYSHEGINRVSLYDLKQNNFVPDMKFSYCHRINKAGLMLLSFYKLDEESGEYFIASSVFNSDTLEELLTVDGHLYCQTIGDKEVFVKLTKEGYIGVYTEIYDLDCRLLLSIEDGFRLWNTSDGNIATYPSENSTTFSIYDKDFNLIKKSREYDQVNAVFGDWVCVTEDGMLKITNNDETVTYALDTYEKSVIVQSFACSVVEKPIAYNIFTNLYLRNSFEENVGTADSPIYEEREPPTELPAGIHISCFNSNIEYGQDGRGIEYYFVPENGKIFRMISIYN